MDKLDLTITLPIDMQTRDKLRAVAQITGHRYVTSLIRHYIAQGLRYTLQDFGELDYAVYQDALAQEQERHKGVLG